jgi:hypothetical protein
MKDIKYNQGQKQAVRTVGKKKEKKNRRKETE